MAWKRSGSSQVPRVHIGGMAVAPAADAQEMPKAVTLNGRATRANARVGVGLRTMVLLMALPAGLLDARAAAMAGPALLGALDLE